MPVKGKLVATEICEIFWDGANIDAIKWGEGRYKENENGYTIF